VPPVKNASQVQSPIDRFVLSQLEASGLSPSPAADRRTLIRRAYFDLIGLPPTAAEIAEFVNDDSPDAFAKVVDRLLASPHYGERWGRYWLDLARYSDTKGYIFNEERNFPHAYNYRDWVIRALNEDLPYDQFLLQQIAADCLPREGDDRSLAAMGFLTLGRRFLGIKPDIIDDRLDVVFRGTMGLTVSCARCHDHKFDPIPTADYYSLYGVFDAAVEKQAPIEAMTPEYEKGLREHEQAVQQALVEGHEKVAADLRAKVAGYLLASHEANQRRAPRTDNYDFVPYFGDMNPFFVNRWRTYLDETAERFDPVMAPFHAFGAVRGDDFAAQAAELAKRFAVVDADPRLRINPLVARLFEGEPPKSLAEVSERYAGLLNEVSGEWEKLIAEAAKGGRPAPTKLEDSDREQLRQVFYGAYAPTNVPTHDVELLLDQKTKDKIAELKKKLVAYAAGPGAPRQAMILEEITPVHSPRIFVRGNASRPGAEVPRQFLAAVSTADRKPFEHKSGRLEMAQKIAARDNPLTARVFVNRVWGGHFGAALVRTASDFGLRSERPSHPELLDYLAHTFMEDGWSIKRLHRRIMLSSTYRQASAHRDDCAARDPENRLLWRTNRRRLDWEATRDALLFASGELDRTIGGPAVEITSQPFSKRRTVYARIERQNLPGLFRAFDFASPDTHSPQRFTTTVPQQALFLMNGPFVIERAEKLTAREDIQGRDTQARIRQSYLVALGREPTADELALGVGFIESGADEQPPPPSATELLAEAWQYGCGAYDEAAQRVMNFAALPQFTGSAWQGGAAYPDPAAGHAMLTAEGGHPGNDLAHAVVRRWTAPRDGAVRIEGDLQLKEGNGDGVRGRIVSSRSGSAGKWLVDPKQKQQKTEVKSITVKAGDTVDFVTDLRGTIEHDTFAWTVVVYLDSRDSDTIAWDSAATFRKPKVRPIDRWTRFAQVLLLSNEFVFVD
jgi:hypothetical protein